jgi:hypothetical protein
MILLLYNFKSILYTYTNEQYNGRSVSPAIGRCVVEKLSFSMSGIALSCYRCDPEKRVLIGLLCSYSKIPEARQ